MWALTHFVGAPAVRKFKVSTMYQPNGLAGFTDVSESDSAVRGGPTYFCRSRAYAPFLVRVDYGWRTARLSGDGGSELYVWILGAKSQIYELDHWAN